MFLFKNLFQEKNFDTKVLITITTCSLLFFLSGFICNFYKTTAFLRFISLLAAFASSTGILAILFYHKKIIATRIRHTLISLNIIYGLFTGIATILYFSYLISGTVLEKNNSSVSIVIYLIALFLNFTYFANALLPLWLLQNYEKITKK